MDKKSAENIAKEGIIRVHNHFLREDLGPQGGKRDEGGDWDGWGEDAVNINAKEHENAEKIQRENAGENAGEKQKENTGEDAERIQKKPVKIFHKDPNAFITLNIFNKK